jgi:hypothetical protein
MNTVTMPTFSLGGAMASLSSLPNYFVHDAPSIGVYALISWAEVALHSYMDSMSYGAKDSPLSFYLTRGVVDTVRQDYLLGLHGMPSNMEGQK